MARGLNKIMIIGYVEQDPHLRMTPEGQAVTTFSVSAHRQWITSGGEARESPEWFNLVAWGSLAEMAGQRLRKDRRIYAEGLLQTRSWETPDGQQCCRTEVVAHKLIPMDDREAAAREGADGNHHETPLSLNRVMIIGNLGRDPEMRYTTGGQAVTTFSLAATRTWTSADGERHDSTEWFNVVTWGSLAEVCSQYLAKGRRVYVEGELHTRGWLQPDGRKLFRTELVASEMILLGPRPRSSREERSLQLEQHEHPF